MIDDLDVPLGNGGGHPGAICFKVEKNKIANLDSYVQKLIDDVLHIISLQQRNSK